MRMLEKLKGLLVELATAMFGIAYSPVYMAGIALHIAARLILSVSYVILLEPTMARDIITSLLPEHHDD